MKLHLKTLVLAAFFAFAALGLQAQEKYHYCIVEGNTNRRGISLSTDGNKLTLIDFTKEEMQELGAINLILREVMKLEAEGWELYNVQTLPNTYGGSYSSALFYYFLRRKM